MSDIPYIGDLVDVWVSLSKNDTSMSVLRTHRITRANGPSVPTYEQLMPNILGFHLLVYSPLMAGGTYKAECTIYVSRGGNPWETDTYTDPAYVVGNTDGGLPPSVAPLSSFRATDAKLREVSKLYWPWPRETLLGTNGEMSVAGNNLVHTQALLWTVLQDWGGSGYAVRARNVIIHKASNTWSYITAAYTHFPFGRQIRRNRGTKRASWQ